jgi:endonuclease G, mitochondrial
VRATPLLRFFNLAKQRRWSDIRYHLSHGRYPLFWLLAVIALILPWLLQQIPDTKIPIPPTQVSGSHIYAGMPVASVPLTVLQRIGYVVGYDERRRNPAWVAYRVPPGRTDSTGNRPEQFETDYATQSRTRHEDFTNSGYDRGHMAPNFAIATRYGSQAQQETFLMSNIVPQKPDLNRGVWRELEMAVAGRNGLANRLDGVWVITGAVYGEQRNTLRNGIEIPNAFYKIIIDEVGGYPRVLGFIIPQDAPLKAKPESYLVSIDEIEQRTGLDFLSHLDDTLEQRIESVTGETLW